MYDLHACIRRLLALLTNAPIAVPTAGRDSGPARLNSPLPSNSSSLSLKFLIPLLLTACFLTGCASIGGDMTSPADPNRTREGYTRDYKMHLKVRESPSGTCNRIQLNVQRQNKLYTTTSGRPAPPQKVTLYDLDCARPIEFERGDVHTASGRERLGSSEAVVEFLATFPQMENQLFGFLFEHRTALP